MLSTLSSVIPSNPSRSERIGYPPMLETELEFQQISAAIGRRKYLIFALTILGLLGGVLLAVTEKPKYSATATVEFAQPSTRELGMNDPNNGTEVSSLDLLNTELKTQQSEITSDGTALEVIQQLHLDAQAPFAIPAKLRPGDPLNRERGLPLDEAPFERERVIKLFKSRLSVDVVKGTRLINITYTDTDPERAAAVANAVVTASIDQTSGRRSSAYSQVSSWLTDQLASLKGRVEDSQKKAEEYENANQRDLAGMTIAGSGAGVRVDASAGSESVPVSRLLALNNQLTSAQVARIAKEAIYRVAASGSAEVVLSIGASSLVSGQGADSSLAPGNGGLTLLQHLREEQVENSVKTAAASVKYGAKNPVMVDLRRQGEAIGAQMAMELGRIRERARTDLELAANAEAGLRQQVDTQQQEVSQWTTKADHLLLLQGEAASSRALYQELYAKLQESQFAAGIRATRVTLLDAARPPTSPASPNGRLDAELGALVGLVLGFVAAFGLELLDDSLHSVRDVQKEIGVPVLAIIPRFTKRDAESAWVVRDPRSHVAEAYRSLRTAVFSNREPGRYQVILFASPLPAEGKSTTCFNAAAALAIQGYKVLMVDADMRRERAAEDFGEPKGSGLSEYLSGEIECDAAIRSSRQVENLSVLPAGAASERAPELLGSSRFAEMVAELRQRFDYILMGSPPTLLFSDSKILMGSVDGYVLVVKASRTPKGDLRKALEELCGTGASFLGIVFNGSRAKVRKYNKFGYEA